MKELTSPQNPLVKSWRKLHQKKWRETEAHYIIEGPHLVQEAIKQKQQPVQTIIYHQDFHAPEAWISPKWQSYVVSDQIFNHLSQTETPQGVMAICQMPKDSKHLNNGRYLLIDGVQDPGNLGTMIRTADAAGMTAVYLGRGCVDLYNHKVLRSAQGSHFHLPILKENLQDTIHKLKQQGIKVFGTDLNGCELSQLNTPILSYALIVGNEGQGVHQTLLDLTDRNLKIPIYGKAESLNVAVAAGILMYSLRS